MRHLLIHVTVFVRGRYDVYFYAPAFVVSNQDSLWKVNSKAKSRLTFPFWKDPNCGKKIVCSRKSTWRRRYFSASSFAVEIMFSEFHRKMEYVFAANRSPGLDAVSSRNNRGTPASSFVNEACEKTLTLKNNRVFTGCKTKCNLGEGFFERSFEILAFFLDKLFGYFSRIYIDTK